jgi:metallo-beta-lactamase family protein
MTRAASLTFLGGNGTVTGSKTLLKVNERQVLIDCGLYQGLRELRRRNWEPLPLAAHAISAVLLTHAHLDHTGYLPLLVRGGFRGPVYATASTIELCRLVLRDSAHLQEEDARYATGRGFSKHSEPRPLYDAQDVERALRLLSAVDGTAGVELPDIGRASWRRAGHILGSSSVHLALSGATSCVLFSGDLGREGHPAQRDDRIA